MSTLQTGDEDSPKLTEENDDIEVVETPPQMERLLYKCQRRFKPTEETTCLYESYSPRSILEH